ncbi:uncharacterized protein LOC105683228 isoform X1 [Athalia rosae]|uniref:uncharacterized protein LOC105683228 isoform X1 n=1 Tax=Athalia rosae TaxID=37344 RepID=UPI0020336B35|nr:uncharacterized protein LOC105683228 isoform X1 [Athalia rosae]
MANVLWFFFYLFFIEEYFLQVFTSPPNIGRGNFSYDPKSIPQNESLLKLFIRLALQTRNRLIRLKLKEDYQDSANDDHVRELPALYSSPESEEFESNLITNHTLGRENGIENGVMEESTNDKLTSNRTNETNRESMHHDNEKNNYAESGVLRSVRLGPTISEPSESASNSKNLENGGIEIENRSLFNIKNTNYITHYADQSSNIGRGDTMLRTTELGRFVRLPTNQNSGSEIAGSLQNNVFTNYLNGKLFERNNGLPGHIVSESSSIDSLKRHNVDLLSTKDQSGSLAGNPHSKTFGEAANWQSGIQGLGYQSNQLSSLRQSADSHPKHGFTEEVLQAQGSDMMNLRQHQESMNKLKGQKILTLAAAEQTGVDLSQALGIGFSASNSDDHGSTVTLSERADSRGEDLIKLKASNAMSGGLRIWNTELNGKISLGGGARVFS